MQQTKINFPSPLWDACKAGDLPLFRHHLAQLSRPLETSYIGRLLLRAASQNQVEMVSLLLQLGNCNVNFGRKKSALHLAVQAGHYEVVDVLLDDIDIDISGAFEQACWSENQAIFERFMRHRWIRYQTLHLEDHRGMEDLKPRADHKGREDLKLMEDLKRMADHRDREDLRRREAALLAPRLSTLLTRTTVTFESLFSAYFSDSLDFIRAPENQEILLLWCHEAGKGKVPADGLWRFVMASFHPRKPIPVDDLRIMLATGVFDQESLRFAARQPHQQSISTYFLYQYTTPADKNFVKGLLDASIDLPRLKVQFSQSRAARFTVLQVLVSDDFLAIKRSEAKKKSTNARFFSIATRLPLELQMKLGNLLAWSAKDFVPQLEMDWAIRSSLLGSYFTWPKK